MGMCDSSNNASQNQAQVQNNNNSNQTPVTPGKYFANKEINRVDTPILDNNVLVSETNHQIDETYQKVKRLGEGAFGEVWLVKHKLTGTEYALKIIEKGPFSNEQQILNEIEILKKLDHPFILKILEFHSTKTKYYIITDYCPQGELFDEVKIRDRFSEKETAYILYQVLLAIRYCHKMRVFHRDIKPENIMIVGRQPSGLLDVKLIDFGTAKVFSEFSKSKAMVGSSYYIAPEVVRGKYDEECDLWSIGVIMYIMLVGTPPFNGEDDDDIIRSVTIGKYETSYPQYTSLSDNAKDLITKLLKFNPSERITAEQALNHPFFNIDEVKQIEYIDETIARQLLLNLENYKSDNLIKCAVIAYLVHQNTHLDQCMYASKLFRAIDTLHDGKLDKNELVNAYIKYLNLNQQQAINKANYVFNNIDNDANGMIESEEFIRACINPNIFTTQQYLSSAFTYFDKDNDGTISSAEVEEKFFQNSNKSEAAREKLQAMFNQIDSNKDGIISYNEFCNMIKGVIC